MGRKAECLTITLTADMAVAVSDAVASGEYDSTGAVISEPLSAWRERRALREPLRAEVQAGIDDIDTGRVRDFDADRIIAMGRRKRSARSRSA
ncbi:MAG: type II toxin-antitoxin system ParD family antitoxin [Verrucomicrobia bacterium]|jgi:antitoxin ParD1/3/4|nr:type II toxin-antitoxin system ParD family antitoxin [Verrucomicrobiota bacterium]